MGGFAYNELSYEELLHMVASVGTIPRHRPAFSDGSWNHTVTDSSPIQGNEILSVGCEGLTLKMFLKLLCS